MSSTAFAWSQPLLQRLDPERAHALTLTALEKGLGGRAPGADDPALAISLFGHQLTNPIGIAAGFDKDARVPDALLRMGFGFAEVGTLTPKAQEGNPQPRVFRLRDDRAIINRLGFNNGGHAAALERLNARAGNPGLVGVNLGANKDSSDRIADYVTGVETFAAVAGYFMVNVSSPNTPGLRDLQAPEAVADLLGRVIEARDAIAKERGTAPAPVSIKLAPDINEDDLAPVIDQIKRAGVDAIAVSNTTIARPADLKAPHAAASEVGGLSGAPLFDRSTAMLARVFEMTDGAIPLIGIGGITTGAQAVAKIEAGATAIQLYTGLVYGGPPLLLEIKSALVRTMNAAGVSSLSALIGQDSRAWAQKSFAA